MSNNVQFNNVRWHAKYATGYHQFANSWIFSHEKKIAKFKHTWTFVDKVKFQDFKTLNVIFIVKMIVLKFSC